MEANGSHRAGLTPQDTRGTSLSGEIYPIGWDWPIPTCCTVPIHTREYTSVGCLRLSLYCIFGTGGHQKAYRGPQTKVRRKDMCLSSAHIMVMHDD